ncbi:MAG: Hsp70 protein-domain-containing protein [Piptocephalis tieghemiana]|nr:MAG: Hsp70 protein-domain-containing protein [Piptocephalis tieghemiana]
MRLTSLLALGPVLTLLVALKAVSTDAAHIAVDFGHDFYKVAIVKPGMPLDIVLNRDSKRKSASTITLRDDTRYHASDAVTLGMRFPQNSYKDLKEIIGLPADSPEVKAWAKRHFATVPQTDTTRKTPLFIQGDPATTGASYSVEELVGFMLRECRALAEAQAKEPIKGMVLTVPADFTKTQRQALVDAAEIAGLRVLSLMNEGSAISLFYALDNVFTKEPEYHLFYDMGAGSTTATLTEFRTISVPDTTKYNKTVTQVSIMASITEMGLGGSEWDARLAQEFAKRLVDSSSGKLDISEIQSNGRAMVKLTKEASKIKEILSANVEAQASIEGAYKDYDFRTKVKRSELEAMGEDLLARVTRPVELALNRAGIQLKDLNSLVLVGGSVRGPAIQTALKDYVGEEKVAQNLNGDEAVVLGASYRAAGLSAKFKVRDVRIREASPYSIDVSYHSGPTGEEDLTRTTIYSPGSFITSKKAMSFKKRTDFSFTLEYGQGALEESGLSAESFGSNAYLDVEVTGLTKALAPYQEGGEEEKVQVEDARVKVIFQMASPMGLVEPLEAQLIMDLIHPADEATTASSSTEAEESQTEGAEKKKEEEEKSKPKKESKVIKLRLKQKYTGSLAMDQEEKAAAITRLKLMDTEEQKFQEKEEARNTLESLVYKIREVLDEADEGLEAEEGKVGYLECLEEKEIKDLRASLADASEWLFEGEGDGALGKATRNMYRSRTDELNKIYLAGVTRKEEYEGRGMSVERSQKALDKAKAFLDEYDATPEEGRYHDAKEVEELRASHADLTQWLKEKLEQQSFLKCYDRPVITSEDLAGKFVNFEFSLYGQTMKVKPEKKKEPESSTESEPETKTEVTEEGESREEEEKQKEGQEEASAPASKEHDEL